MVLNLFINKLRNFQNGKNAASLSLAEQYISAFKHLAKTNNTLILPSNAGDISSLVTQALSVYKTVASQDLGSHPTIGSNDFDHKNNITNQVDNTSNCNDRKKMHAGNVSKMDIE